VAIALYASILDMAGLGGSVKVKACSVFGVTSLNCPVSFCDVFRSDRVNGARIVRRVPVETFCTKDVNYASH